MNSLLARIVASPALHSRWLNTLSYLENSGARLIAACEHPTLVREEMLKHAAEEFRHAYHLKQQMAKLPYPVSPNYALTSLLGGMATLHYLPRLNLFAARHYRREAYLLVTYAIELRASALYPLYDAVLRAHSSRVIVRSILLEEEEHLEEMRQGLSRLPAGFAAAAVVCAYEKRLYTAWQATIFQELTPCEQKAPSVTLSCLA